MGSVNGLNLPGGPMLEVLSQYSPLIAKARWTPLGSAGGFSGGRLWRGISGNGREFALKAHPPGTTAKRLGERIHRWMKMACEAAPSIVPSVEATRDGRTVVEFGDRVWDVTTWLCGKADFHTEPSDTKLVAAIKALANVHKAWEGEFSSGPCPAIQRRLRALAKWQALVASGWKPQFDRNDPVRQSAETAFSLLPRVLDRTFRTLAPWTNQVVPLQPCLCDIWHDHVLFEGDRVTGLIDFAAAKIDNVAVDLARLLGSLIPDDRQRTEAALEAYSHVRRSPDPELIRVLDISGVVVGVTNWLRWLYCERRAFADRLAVANRLAALTERLAKRDAI
jgi:Ser/Thr protein kinase RdoA (MazF antagonist)